MRYSLLALSLATVLAGCQPASTPEAAVLAAAPETAVAPVTVAAESESAKLNQWFEAKYEEQLQMSPLQLTAQGRKDQYDQIDDVTAEAEAKQLAWLAATVEQLKSQFDYSKLDVEAKTSYDLWIYQYQRSVEAAKFRDHNYWFNQMRGMHSMLPQMLMNFHKVDEVADLEAYIKRIGGIAKAIADLQQRAAKSAELGVRPPRFAYEGVIVQLNNLLSGQPFTTEGKAGADEKEAPLWTDVNKKIDALIKADKLTDAQATQLRNDAKTALTSQFQPAYAALRDFLQAELAFTSAQAQGASALPNGVEFYNLRLKQSTTTALTADEIHQIGLDEVARLTQEMIAIKDKVGFKGDLAAFFQFIKTDPQFFYPDTDEGRQAYITDSEAYLAVIADKLPQYFGILPKSKLVVKRVEAFREQPGAAQHYSSGTADGSRPGVYYAHLSDMKAMPKNEMEAIAYHEGSPGHHMQISIAQELTAVPKFRTQARFTAYSEGWGLYSEILAKEMGGYQSPYSDFGRLITEMWRAVRLVVDTGMHAKGWTEQQAIDYFLEKTPVAKTAVISEVRRYLVTPGQATSYKIGMLKILEIRAKAREQLGDKFDIRGFHDTVLNGGALPLELLEKRVQQWVDTVKSAS
ncbi:DUF885 domain-containing protein [Rheinheimera riviphila]|uniref:DUF885 domain-containing protein n=1 Tax=Rheinheimera riviphila TaxID=1834037 RepID=A0A437QM34_9GAMM|nr:DUF885 domain-containing protein [Rheinheimera riviphila]RVU35584.1 DUF885 domain-containing protein [Rheinheimera riviphila]